MTVAIYEQHISRFDGVSVLVVGDVYLDENVYGSITKVSLEAPIPIFEVETRKYNPGAAGNTACNAAALGAKTFIVGVVGADPHADILRAAFAEHGVDVSGLVVDESRPTNTYGKLRAGGYHIPEQEVLRTDTPKPAPVQGTTEALLIANIEARAAEVDVIIVTDQVSSTVRARLLKVVVACAQKHGVTTVGDSRERIFAFKGFDVIVPNGREAVRDGGGDAADDATIQSAGESLLGVAKNVCITRGPHGVMVFEEGGALYTVPAKASQVADVTGAGDTATATLGVCLGAGVPLRDAAEIAMAAAGVAVAHKGVVTVSQEALIRALRGEGTNAKIRTLSELQPLVKSLQAQGRRVVWTNGCFDILHVGHITYLQRAAREGDVLIVGLNSDESVRAVKGPDRPIVPENERAQIIAALEGIDYVTVFSETSTVPLLEALHPDVYTKGGDYTLDTINQEERHLVEGYGGKIVIVPGVDGRSTSAIVREFNRED